MCGLVLGPCLASGAGLLGSVVLGLLSQKSIVQSARPERLEYRTARACPHQPLLPCPSRSLFALLPRSLRAPCRLIADNAGVEGEVIVQRLLGKPFEVRRAGGSVWVVGG